MSDTTPIVVCICILLKPGLKKDISLSLFALKARFHMAAFGNRLKPYNQTHFNVQHKTVFSE